MSSETNDPKPTWTDPAPTAPVAIPAIQATPTAPTDPTPVAPVTPVVVATQRKSGPWVNLLLGAAAIIAIGGVAFAIGRSTAPASAAGITTFPGGDGLVISPGGSFDPNAPGGPRNGAIGSGGPTIEGTVASIDGDTMTITLPSGDTMTVTIDGETTYHESTDATAADVAVGDDVSVRIDGGRFQTNSGDSGTATDVTASDVTVSR